MGLKTWLGLKKARPPATRLPPFVMKFSYAQIAQDLWVLSETRLKRGGFFVEFGASDGVTLSNTYLLENHFGWTGILAEPVPMLHDSIRRNRMAALSTKCVWSRSGEIVPFRVCRAHEYSTIEGFQESSHHDRSQYETIHVETISLNDLLVEQCAPAHIDYISMDTEGSEFDILSTFDFDRFRVDLFSIEHNRTSNEIKIDTHMAERGYERAYPDNSHFDGWYRRRGLD
jgi:FkbM family methyltransferase